MGHTAAGVQAVGVRGMKLNHCLFCSNPLDEDEKFLCDGCTMLWVIAAFVILAAVVVKLLTS